MCRRSGDGSGGSHAKAVLGALALGSLLLLTTVIALVQGAERYIRTTRRLNARRLRQLLARLRSEGEHAKEDEQRREYAYLDQPRESITVAGFFHPFCNAGGGGERVLFQALAHHQARDPHTLCVVYTGDLNEDEGIDKAHILERAHQRFGIALQPARVHFLPLTRRFLVEDGYWKHATLLGQSFGAAVLGAEAMALLVPDVFIDTMGYAFAYPIVRFFAPGIPIGAYVHYPTISTDMLERVKTRAAGHTNTASVANSTWRTNAKLIYYHLFASAYTFCLGRANTLVANSSWTKAHLDTLLFGRPPNPDAKPIPVPQNAGVASSLRTGAAARSQKKKKKSVEIVYPPCDTTAFSAFPLEGPTPDEQRDPGLLVSLAQFRPEKEHATQLRLLRALFDLDPAYRTGGTLAATGAAVPQVRLILMGSCRNAGDEARIEGLKQLARELGVENSINFKVNAPFPDILATLSRASIGLSTMVDEHFGINVVEFMAAGLITLSHASAGPYLDIAVPVLPDAPSSPTPTSTHPFQDPTTTPAPLPTGFHARTPPTFATALAEILALPAEEVLAIRGRARARARACFGSEGFEAGWRADVWEVLVRALEERRRTQKEKGKGGRGRGREKEE